MSGFSRKKGDAVEEFMETITREQMIQMAKETRKKVTNAPVSEEEMRKYPVHIEKMLIPTREGSAEAYYSYMEGGVNHDMMIINYHGGGFIRERTPNDELFCRKLNHALGCKVLDVDYKIAPDYPYPAAVYETYDVLQWVYVHREELGLDENKIVVSGHSAGGNLAIVNIMIALEEKTFCPALLIADYPPLDVYTDPGEKPAQDTGIPAERARLYNLYYCDRERQKEPYASPLFASDDQLKGFPPSLFITASLDSLCVEAEEFALRLARLGGEVTLKRFQNVGHAFTIYRREKHQEAFDLIVKTIRGNIDMKMKK